MGLYIKKDISSHTRVDLSVFTVDYEALWIEVDCKSQSNIVCRILYRHPNNNFDNFTVYMNATLDKTSNDNKICMLLGDFNINLLDYDSHILQPTRITDHSAILIDHIYLNSIEHHENRTMCKIKTKCVCCYSIMWKGV